MTDIGREYGSALFMLAVEEDKKNEYFDALSAVKAAFESEKEYIDFLASPNIPVSERTKALEEAFGNFLPENVLSFLQLLTEKGHAREFFSCVEEYKKLLDESMKVSVATVISAVELTETEKKKIKQSLKNFSGNSVTLECSVDEKLLGGLVVKMDGKVIDTSIKSRLAEVKDVMSK